MILEAKLGDDFLRTLHFKVVFQVKTQRFLIVTYVKSSFKKSELKHVDTVVARSSSPNFASNIKQI